MIALPKSAQPSATKAMQKIYAAEDRAHPEKAIEAFTRTYGTKWPEAVAKITDDAEELPEFYDFPAEHWIHLRTTDVIVKEGRSRVGAGDGGQAGPADWTRGLPL
ncbi:transposase, partial [Streptomyces mirabilis]|uniref:transposase n=1 Tax=Streptomyces mirabilis TaxID=68239 RepID=UPI00367C1E07